MRSIHPPLVQRGPIAREISERLRMPLAKLYALSVVAAVDDHCPQLTGPLREARICSAGQGEQRLRPGPCQAQSVQVCDAPYPDKA